MIPASCGDIPPAAAVLVRTSRFLIDALYIELENMGLPVVRATEKAQKAYEGVFISTESAEDLFKIVHRSRLAHNVLGLLRHDGGHKARDRSSLYRWVKNDVPFREVLPSFGPNSTFWVRLADGDYSSTVGMRNAEVQRAVRHGLQCYFHKGFGSVPRPLRDHPDFLFFVTPPEFGIGLWVDYGYRNGVKSLNSAEGGLLIEDKRCPGRHLRSSVAAAILCGARYVPGRDVLVDPYCEDGGIFLVEARRWAQRVDPGMNSEAASLRPSAFPGSDDLWRSLVEESASRQLCSDDSVRVYGTSTDPVNRARARRNLPGSIVSAASLVEYVPPESPTLIVTRSPRQAWSSPEVAAGWVGELKEWASGFRAPRAFVLHGPGQPLPCAQEVLYLGHYGSLYKLLPGQATRP